MPGMHNPNKLTCPSFGLAAQTLYLEKLRELGKKYLAAEFVGVSHDTIGKHRNANPDFEAAELLALKLRDQRIQGLLEHQAVHGIPEPLYTPKGAPIMVMDERTGKMVHAHRMKFETGLRTMVLKAAAKRNGDHSYADQVQHDHSVQVGVMVMPQPVQSVGGWEKLVASTKKPKELSGGASESSEG